MWIAKSFLAVFFSNERFSRFVRTGHCSRRLPASFSQTERRPTLTNRITEINRLLRFPHREFYYQQIDKYARQELSNGRQNAEEIHIPADSELIKVLNVHYNRQNHISVSVLCSNIRSNFGASNSRISNSETGNLEAHPLDSAVAFSSPIILHNWELSEDALPRLGLLGRESHF